MNAPAFRDWRSIRAEVLRRIRAREWPPGALIPNEADLAAEFGCARATVNRALRSLAEAGLLDRRRKAGTRVAATPVARAVLDIPLIRQEIESRGGDYGYRRLLRETARPPAPIAAAMATGERGAFLHLTALHLSDGAAYALEDRWINLAAAPGAREEPFDAVSGNEWLLANAPYVGGDIAFAAATATEVEAERLGCAPGAALFEIERVTRNETDAITHARLLFAPGHRLRTAL